jgi:GT2 family glycosyltransferase
MTNILDLELSGSIVLYNNDITMVSKAINSFLNTTLKVRLYLIDNSENDDLKILQKIDTLKIEYHFNNKNIGFGAGHNIAIKKSIESDATYHLILNPDVYFEKGNLEIIYQYMQANRIVGILSPKTIYPNGNLQYLCRLLPTPFDFFVKRFVPPVLLPYFQKRRDSYEFRNRSYEDIMEVPFLSGCFMFTRIEALKVIGLFDENIFMYTEDIDLCRRVCMKYKTIYYPKAEIIHGYERGSLKNIKLFFIHMKSVIYYFNKWGWFWDKERYEINNRIINQFR